MCAYLVIVHWRRLAQETLLKQFWALAGSSRSLKNVTKHWMPLLLRLGVHVPVILVSSKQDLAEQEDEELAAVNPNPLCLSMI